MKFEDLIAKCPKCGSTDKTAHRRFIDNHHAHAELKEFKCDNCGYSVELQYDGFFHNTGTGLHFDSILAWDKWQKAAWKEVELSIISTVTVANYMLNNNYCCFTNQEICL